MNDNVPEQNPAPPSPDTHDPAMKSLADALRVSFRLLSVLMVLFVVLFIATGFKSIQPQEAGIIKVFGRVVDVARPGFVYNWPFPVGEIQIVPTQEQRLVVDSFWMDETPQDRLKPLSERRPRGEGLRPGWDGYLLTGDRNLIHVKIDCTYRIQDALAVARNIQGRSSADLQDRVNEVMRTILCQAAIHAAATRTADAMQVDPLGFREDVHAEAQQLIDRLLAVEPGQPNGIRITQVLVPADGKIWPLAAYQAYEAAQSAKSEKQEIVNKAIAQAKETLIGAIGGENYRQLVGEPWNPQTVEDRRTQAGTWQDEPYNLISQYADAQAAVDAAPQRGVSGEDLAELRTRARQLREQIDIVLTRATTGGEASTILANAEAAKTRTVQRVERQANQFARLLGEYRKLPEVFLQNHWARALDEVLSQPTNIKWVLHPGEDGAVIHLNNDPRVLKQLRDYRLRAEQEAEQRQAEQKRMGLSGGSGS